MLQAARSLRLAWWNTHLTTLSGSSHRRIPVARRERWDAAAHVVRSLCAEGKDILVLGELTREGADQVAADTTYQRLDVPDSDARAGIVVLFKKSTIHVEFKEKIEIELSDRTTKQSLLYEIIVDSLPPINLIPCHWPAQGQPEAARDRRKLAADLHLFHKRRVRESSPQGLYTILCGDFNDEPFAISMTDDLRGTRDRSIVRNDPAVLYNPFWRLLGEHDCHVLNTASLSQAGTYYNKRNSDSKWYTFDQFLVSQNLVSAHSPWQLVEQDTKIWNDAYLRAGKGIAFGFDHFPVAITLEAHAQRGEHG